MNENVVHEETYKGPSSHVTNGLSLLVLPDNYVENEDEGSGVVPFKVLIPTVSVYITVENGMKNGKENIHMGRAFEDTFIGEGINVAVLMGKGIISTITVGKEGIILTQEEKGIFIEEKTDSNNVKIRGSGIRRIINDMDGVDVGYNDKNVEDIKIAVEIRVTIGDVPNDGDKVRPVVPFILIDM